VCAIVHEGKFTQAVTKARRVLRVEGWRNNLKKAVIEVIGQAKERYAWGKSKIRERTA
jgi:hypothetical protein